MGTSQRWFGVSLVILVLKKTDGGTSPHSASIVGRVTSAESWTGLLPGLNFLPPCGGAKLFSNREQYYYQNLGPAPQFPRTSKWRNHLAPSS